MSKFFNCGTSEFDVVENEQLFIGKSVVYHTDCRLQLASQCHCSQLLRITKLRGSSYKISNIDKVISCASKDHDCESTSNTSIAAAC